MSAPVKLADPTTFFISDGRLVWMRPLEKTDDYISIEDGFSKILDVDVYRSEIWLMSCPGDLYRLRWAPGDFYETYELRLEWRR